MVRPQLRRRAPTKWTPHDLSRLLVTVTSPDDAASEAYRTLGTNLLYTWRDAPPKVIMVTSPGPKEGKSTTCANLGVVLAQASKNTLVLDCDFRKPTQHKFFGLRNVLGVVDILVGERSLQEILQEPLMGLKVGTGGSIPTNPAQILASAEFAGLVNQVRQEFDYALVDGPPVGLISDAAILSAQADGCLLVVDPQSTPRRSIRDAIRNLETVGANVLGTVVNNAGTFKAGYDR
jgi:capsular exopolysaccharide synthesis family protein